MSYSKNIFLTPEKAKTIAFLNKNISGGTLFKGTVVRSDGNGIEKVDPGVESQVDAISGVVNSDIVDQAFGNVIFVGLVENVPGGFNFGDVIFLDKSGNLTNIKPSIGVNSFGSGDFVIKIGTIIKNSAGQRDLLVNIQNIGQL